MLVTHSSPSLHTSPTPDTRPCSPLSSRTALADSTNFNPHSNACSPAYPKSCLYPTSSTRTSCGWNDFESSTTSLSSLAHPRHHHSSTPSPFPVTSKAPPTVSISLSAACSRSIPGERSRNSQAQGLDLPDVRSVIPFPSVPLNGDMDVDMVDGTRVLPLDGRSSPVRQAARKRHSAHSSISSSGGPVRDAKQKRPRRSKRQVTELWWLGVVHRSILRAIEARKSVGALDASDGLLSGPRELDAMDRVLVEKIQRRLDDNGCVEGWALPNPLPRISSPSISVPSVNLVAPSGKTLQTGSAPLSLASELNPTGNVTSGGAATSLPIPEAPPSTSLSITSHSHSPTSSSIATSHRRHVRLETSRRPREAPLHPSIPRRSPSPPARTGTVSAHAQTLTLTIPQLVASLTLAYREQSGVRVRGRTLTERRKNAGRSLSSVSFRGLRRSDGASYEERVLQSLTSPARLPCAPQRKSPLSRVVYAES